MHRVCYTSSESVKIGNEEEEHPCEAHCGRIYRVVRWGESLLSTGIAGTKCVCLSRKEVEYGAPTDQRAQEWNSSFRTHTQADACSVHPALWLASRQFPAALLGAHADPCAGPDRTYCTPHSLSLLLGSLRHRQTAVLRAACDLCSDSFAF